MASNAGHRGISCAGLVWLVWMERHSKAVRRGTPGSSPWQSVGGVS
ncbi:hypothetical protein RR42_s2146 [Cupriavidus basilensis]|uniref:Uncharacterized protein n=1 Tax=Cupriavidus basilensis TaxID=68895 RepID=A0A0C4YKY1_9BURK|nr:hypothetical protein RR42_s2146 [Cupriavidus basilensis]